MALQEVENGGGRGPGLDIVLAEGHDRRVAFGSQGQGFSVKDAIDLLLELLGFWMLLGVVWAVGALDVLFGLLCRMEDAFVMHGLRKDLRNHRAVILA